MPRSQAHNPKSSSHHHCYPDYQALSFPIHPSVIIPTTPTGPLPTHTALPLLPSRPPPHYQSESLSLGWYASAGSVKVSHNPLNNPIPKARSLLTDRDINQTPAHLPQHAPDPLYLPLTHPPLPSRIHHIHTQPRIPLPEPPHQPSETPIRKPCTPTKRHLLQVSQLMQLPQRLVANIIPIHHQLLEQRQIVAQARHVRVREVLAQFREVEARELRQGAEAVCDEEGVIAVGAFCVGGEGERA